jgi:class 3 adenylate cyclase
MSRKKHAVIMFTDIAGYMALKEEDNKKAFDLLHRSKKIHHQIIVKHHGKLLKEIEDGILASFDLTTDAVRCAVEIQRKASTLDIPLKIGIHEGDMLFNGLEITGDDVRIASSLQEISNGGCITISDSVYEHVKNKKGFSAEFQGEQLLDHHPVKIYRVNCYQQCNNYEENTPRKATKKKKIISLYVVLLLLLIILILSFLWSLLSLPARSGAPLPDDGRQNPMEIPAQVSEKGTLTAG